MQTQLLFAAGKPDHQPTIPWRDEMYYCVVCQSAKFCWTKNAAFRILKPTWCETRAYARVSHHVGFKMLTRRALEHAVARFDGIFYDLVTWMRVASGGVAGQFVKAGLTQGTKQAIGAFIPFMIAQTLLHDWLLTMLLLTARWSGHGRARARP